MSASGARFRLYYWPGMSGRGEFARLVLEETATPYDDVCRGMAMEEAVKVCYGSKERFAVPALEDTHVEDPDTGKNLCFSQSGSIVEYLAEHCDGGRLLPKHPALRARARALMADVVDFMEEGCRGWHAIDYNQNYSDQKEETKPFIEYVVTRRAPRWFAHFDNALRRNANNNCDDGASDPVFFVGKELSFADLAVYHVLDGWRSELSEDGICQKTYQQHATPLVLRFMDAVAKRPNIAAYLNSDRRNPFTVGSPGF